MSSISLKLRLLRVWRLIRKRIQTLIIGDKHGQNRKTLRTQGHKPRKDWHDVHVHKEIYDTITPDSWDADNSKTGPG